MPKTIHVSDKGLASCPACLNHIRLDDERGETVCPFCDETLQIAAREQDEGGQALDVLRSSRSGLLASALVGAGLSLTVACADPDPGDGDNSESGWDVGEDAGDDVNYEEGPNHNNMVADYGGYPGGGPNDEEPSNQQEPDAGHGDVDDNDESNGNDGEVDAG